MDTRVKELSRVLTSYSCDLKKGEKVLIDYEGECARPLVRQLIKDAYKLGARPYVNHRDSSVLREILLCADEEQIEFLNDYQLYQMKGMDAYTAVRPAKILRNWPTSRLISSICTISLQARLSITE